MRHMRKLLAVVLAILMALAMTACKMEAPAEVPQESETVEQAEAPDLYQAGTYTATAMGRNGPVTVEVTMAADRIENVVVTEHQETAGIGDLPIERIPAAIVEYQSLAVDIVTSATLTSDAILEAVKDCITQAGGDVDALLAVKIDKVAGELVKKSADVVIVGGGGAGLAAAVSASTEGANVILIEKAATLGGNTKLSTGSMQAADPERQKAIMMTDALKDEVRSYLAMESDCEKMTEWQNIIQQQFDEYLASGNPSLFDSSEFHALQTYIAGDRLGNPELIDKMCAEALDTVNWLGECGVPWEDYVKAGSGSLWQRPHRVEGGIVYIDVFSKKIADDQLPVEILLETKATELIVDESGRVTGVRAEDGSGTPYEIYGENGVILASGGFGANVEMREKYNTDWSYLGKNVPTTNAPTITGDGIVMAEAIGANLVGMNKIQLLAVADPKTGSLSNTIGFETDPYVNMKGYRFVNEAGRRDEVCNAILLQPDSCYWIISSASNSDLNDEFTNVYGLTRDFILSTSETYMADTLEELAVKIGIEPDVLVNTIEKFNAAYDAGYDEEFGRSVFNPGGRISLDDGPFYACLRAPAVHHTMGGVEINSEAQVLREDGAVIEGLYAAGEVTGGIHGGNRVGANAITDIMVYGRLAGRNAATGK